MAEWMFRTLGQEFGPIRGRVLRRMIRSGELIADDEVRTTKSRKWRRVADLGLPKPADPPFAGSKLATQTSCPNCRTFIQVSADAFGETLDCPTCREGFTVYRIVRREKDPPSGGQALDTVEQPQPAKVGPDAPSEQAATQPQLPTEEPSKRIGRFHLQQVLGEGAFGVVYRAFDPALERDVALKVPKFGSNQKREVRRFLTEAKAAARLRHPNIIAVHESGKADGNYFIAYEYIAGQPLDVVIKETQPDFQRAAELIKELSGAMAYAEEMGIIHRDIKPANILMDDTGHPQIADFGLARRIDENSSMTADGSPLGTPAYMAPEQARGEQKQVGPCSDQYSLGVVLYELLTGTRPYSGSVHAIIAEVSDPNREPPSVKSLVPKAPSDLAAICGKAMEKDPDRRYPTSEDLAADLGRWLSGSPVMARSPRSWERCAKWVRRNPYISASILVVVIALSVVSYSLTQANKALAEKDAANRLVTEKTTLADAAQTVATEATTTAERVGQELSAEKLKAIKEIKQREQQLSKSQADNAEVSQSLQQREAELQEKSTEFEREQQLKNDALVGKELGIALAEAEREFERAGDLCDHSHVGEGLLRMTAALDRLTNVEIPDEEHATFQQKILQSFDSYRQRIAVLEDVISTRFGPKQLQEAGDSEIAALDEGNIPNPPMSRYQQERLEKAQSNPQARRKLRQRAGEFVEKVNARVGKLSFTTLDKQWSADGGVFLTVFNNRSIPITPHPFPPVHPGVVYRVTAGTAILNSSSKFDLEWPLDVDFEIKSAAYDGQGGAVAVVGSWAGYESKDPPEYKSHQGRLAVWRRKGDGRFNLDFAINLSKWPLDYVTFSRNNDLVLASSRQTLYVRDAVTGGEVTPPIRFPAKVDAVSTDSTGRTLAVACADVVWIHNLVTATRIQLRHDAPVRTVAISPNDRMVVTSADDQLVRFWNIDGRSEVISPLFHPVPVIGAVVLEDMSRVATVDEKGTMRLWRLPSSNSELESDEETGELDLGTPVDAVFSPDSRWLLVSALKMVQKKPEYSLHLIDASTGSPRCDAIPIDFEINSIGFSPSADLFYSTSTNAARFWRTNNGKPVDLPFRHPSHITRLAVSHDDQQFASVTEDRLFVWSLLAHDVYFDSPVSSRPVCVAMSPSGNHVAVGCADGLIRFWSLETNALTSKSIEITESPTALKYSPDGSQLLVGTGLGTIEVHEADGGAQLRRPVRHPTGRAIRSVGVSPSGDRMIASNSGGVFVWDSQTGALLSQVVRTPESNIVVAMSPDGSRKLSGRKLSQLDYNSELTADSLALWTIVHTGMTLDDGHVHFLDEPEWRQYRKQLLGNDTQPATPANSPEPVVQVSRPLPEFPSTLDRQKYLRSLIQMLNTGVLAKRWDLSAAQSHHRNAAAMSSDDPLLSYCLGLCLLRKSKEEAQPEFHRTIQSEGYMLIPAWQAVIYKHLAEKDYSVVLNSANEFTKRLQQQKDSWPSKLDRMEAAGWLGRVIGYIELKEVSRVDDDNLHRATELADGIKGVLTSPQLRAFQSGRSDISLEYLELQGKADARRAALAQVQRKRNLQTQENLETKKDQTEQQRQALIQERKDFEKKTRQDIGSLDTKLREMLTDHKILKARAREAARDRETIGFAVDYELEASLLNWELKKGFRIRESLMQNYASLTGKKLEMDGELAKRQRSLNQKIQVSPSRKRRTSRRRTMSISLRSFIEFDVKDEASYVVDELKALLNPTR